MNARGGMHLTIQDKIIAGITIIHSLMGSVWIYLMTSQLGFSPSFILTNGVLALTGFVAAVGWFKRLRWGAVLGIVFFAIQLLHIITPNFQFSFTLGFNLNIAVGWFSGVELAINLFALAMLLWMAYRLIAPNSSFKPNSLRGSA